MCGISGFSVDLNKLPNSYLSDTILDQGLDKYHKSILERSIQAMEHRGPDDEGIFLDSHCGIGMGHRRLSILDLSPLGHQPMLSEDSEIVLVFNGEIYNFIDLRRELLDKKFIFKGNSDTEVILNLYISQGIKFLSKLNGIFALSIWDKRIDTLYIARDAMGVKPLYFINNEINFSFASEVKALLHLNPAISEIDVGSIHRYLNFIWCPGEGTPFKGVNKVSPGEVLSIRSGKILDKWVWYQSPIFSEKNYLLDKKKVFNGIATNLSKAVDRQMISDVPVGAFLSGGLDSSSIVAFASRINPEIRCYTIDFVGGGGDGIAADLPYAQKVARHLNVPLEVVSVDSSKTANDLERMVLMLDEPLADPAALYTYYISKLAGEQGIKVLLSGVGGDDIFTGYRRHTALKSEMLWSWLPKIIRSWVAGSADKLDQRNLVSRRIAKFLSGMDMDGDARLVNYYGWANEMEIFSLYSPEFKERLGDELAATPIFDFLRTLPSNLQPLDRMLALEQRFFLADHNLVYTDKMSMAAGVEVRTPFLDVDLVEFASRIPLKMKHHGNAGKWALKKAMEPYLPRDVIYRSKSGFGAPVRKWMLGDWHDLKMDLLSFRSIKNRGIFDPMAIQRLIFANDAGRIDASYTLLTIMCIEIWCRGYLDKNQVTSFGALH